MPTDREVMQQALPCPFCGGEKVSVAAGSTFRWMFAICDECGAQAGEVRKQTMGAGTPQEWHEAAQRRAIEEWNKRARLAQEELEPVAWMHPEKYKTHFTTIPSEDLVLNGYWTPLYTDPPQREWQGLTDEERAEAWAKTKGDLLFRLPQFSLAIEAKLKEKNSD